MNKKYVGILIVVAGLLLLIGIIYIIFFHKFVPKEEMKTIEQEAAQSTSTLPREGGQTVLQEQGGAVIKYTPPTESEKKQEDLKRMASAFAERFGSFSNQSNYGNIGDLKIFMTSKMRVWADNYVAEAIAKKNDASIYYGITTKAVSMEIKKFDDAGGAAEVLVGTRRREATGTTDNASFFQQDILIIFAKENGAWKVDNAFWQAK